MNLYPDAIQRAVACVGRPYRFGSKWPVTAGPVIPVGPVDCSGFSRWVLKQAGIAIPDGSYDQIRVCHALPTDQQQDAPPLSLGFYEDPHTGVVDHVVVSCGRGIVVEARGEPHNQVILTPAALWLKEPGFLGFYAPPEPQA